MGFYAVQQTGIQPNFNLHGVFRSNENGKYWFQEVKPKFFPVPYYEVAHDFILAPPWLTSK